MVGPVETTTAAAFARFHLINNRKATNAINTTPPTTPPAITPMLGLLAAKACGSTTTEGAVGVGDGDVDLWLEVVVGVAGGTYGTSVMK